jgi:hypothetical protein
MTRLQTTAKRGMVMMERSRSREAIKLIDGSQARFMEKVWVSADKSMIKTASRHPAYDGDLQLND